MSLFTIHMAISGSIARSCITPITATQKYSDTNLAAVTSIWDRLFGALYIPENEYTPQIRARNADQYRSFWQNTACPFKDRFAMLTGGPVRTQSTLGAARTDVNAREP